MYLKRKRDTKTMSTKKETFTIEINRLHCTASIQPPAGKDYSSQLPKQRIKRRKDSVMSHLRNSTATAFTSALASSDNSAFASNSGSFTAQKIDQKI
tara:strand:+ start:281 stop:571 length:291 start_codon:yes stop_codon:yes gene_type:complete